MNVSRGLLDGLDSSGFNTAISEATCLGLEVDTEAATLRLDLTVLTVPADETAPQDHQVCLNFTGVSRVAASLRIQRWDDIEAEVLPLRLDGLDEAIRSFGGGRLHGWEFIDVDDSGWSLWRELLSFDTKIDDHTPSHVLEFSQEEGIDPRELDVRVWFDSLTVHDAKGKEIAPADFIAGGVRWWKAHDAGDPRTIRPGIVPPL
ncbi:hypothetical protein ACFYT3_27885 [Nocardia amikacinitolerans]|uniref:hypothetical protein n=1 Tax=Nocardia amikacinitolerans TaxID=756689 RepID=UPI0020A31037|nr:hypothetical protein [Nocardia amikacinitolerans]MCP2291293.1 hypothetical protein [Nocardia amikacinitolerans]